MSTACTYAVSVIVAVTAGEIDVTVLTTVTVCVTTVEVVC